MPQNGKKSPDILGVLVLTFGMTIRISMASILGVAAALAAYRFV